MSRRHVLWSCPRCGRGDHDGPCHDGRPAEPPGVNGCFSVIALLAIVALILYAGASR